MKLLGQTNDVPDASLWDALRDECRIELEQSRRELREISLMIEQSQLELSKLQQRNASISAHLQQVQSQFETLSNGDIRMAYDSALDAQQRLFVMRGQLDKLQSDQTHIERYTSILDKVLKAIETGDVQVGGRRGPSAVGQTVEMMIQAQEAERQRLARQMHDGPAQALSNFILQTEIAMRYFEIDQKKAKEELANIKAAAAATFQKVRGFIFELRPMMLDDLGLSPTVSRYIESYKDQSGIEVRFITPGSEQRLEPYIEVMVFRAIQELLGNVARHSQATQVKLQVDISAKEVRVNVEDNGKGFEIESLGEKGGMGLKLIQERVEMLGGDMQIHSVVGQGTHINFRIPAA